MEDILDIYEMPYNPAVPVVCMDEKPYQLLGEAREPLPMRPGDTQKIDSEYVRNGTCSIFVFVEPLGGVRHVSVRERRTVVDWAEEIRYHYTPKHGSWLDIAEIELNVMTRQCLSRRMKDIVLLRQELAVWESDRNEHAACIQWHFTADNARTKLLSLYPKFVTADETCFS